MTHQLQPFWVTAGLCGLAIALSVVHVYRLVELGAEYTTLIVSTQTGTNTNLEETYAYAPLVNRIKLGQPTNDPYLWEYRHERSPFMSELLPAVAMGVLAKVIGVQFSFVVVEILGPVLLVFLLMQIGVRAGVDRFVSIVSAFAAVFTPMLFSLVPYPATLHYIIGATELEFQRLFYPLLPMILVSLSILCVHGALTSKKNNRLIILISGVTLGALFYTYFFSWTMVWTGMGFMLVTSIRKAERHHLKHLAAILIAGLVIGIPYIVNGWQFGNSDIGRTFWEKSLIPAGELHAGKMIRYALLVLLVLRFDRNWARQITRRILLCFLTAAMILPDLSQFVLRGNIESDHWIVRFLYPLSTFVAVLGFGSWLRRRFPKGSVFFLGIVVMGAGIRLAGVINDQMAQPVHLFQLGDERSALFEFMEQHLESDSVVGSLSFTESVYLVSYTPFYPFLPHWTRTIALTDEPIDRLVFLARELNVSERYFDDVMPVPLVPVNHPDLPRFDQKAFAVVFGIEYLFDQPPYERHQALLAETKKKFRQTIPQPGKLDYLLMTPTDREFSNWKPTDRCRPIFTNSQYQLYRFHDCRRL